MNAATASTLSRDPFMPQPPKVRGRAITLAVLAHLLLILAIAFGVNWRSAETTTTVAAELWSATPQAAAPRAVEEPPPTPQPEPAAKPVVKAAEPVAPPKPAPTLPDPQIAIEKAKRDEAKRVAAEQEQKRAKAEKLKAERLEAEREQRAKDELAQKKAAADKAEQTEKAEAARQAAAREAYLKRMQGLAGASGAPSDTGTASRSSGPSANYGGRVAARVKPNIVFTDTIDGNPQAVVQVKLASDGTIVAKRLVQSSGVKAWDDAVLRAIDRTEILPLDNGRAPPPFEIGFRPRD